MKFPALPRPAFRRPWPRPRLKFVLASAGLFVFSFLLALYLFFPAGALRDRIEGEFARRTGGTLSMENLSLRFPPGLRAEEVAIAGLPGRERVEMDSLSLSPLWLSLPTRTPGIRFDARLQGGRIEGKYRKGGALEARAAKVSFSEPLASGSALRLAGTVREGTFRGAVPVTPGTDTLFDFTVDGVQLAGLDGLGVSGGVLPLGTVSLRGTGKGNALRVDTLSASGGAVSATGNASLLLAAPRDQTRVNANLTLRPAPNAGQGVRDLLELFAQPAGDGSYRFRLAGTLGSPVFAK